MGKILVGLSSILIFSWHCIYGIKQSTKLHQNTIWELKSATSMNPVIVIGILKKKKKIVIHSMNKVMVLIFVFIPLEMILTVKILIYFSSFHFESVYRNHSLSVCARAWAQTNGSMSVFSLNTKSPLKCRFSIVFVRSDSTSNYFQFLIHSYMRTEQNHSFIPLRSPNGQLPMHINPQID